jgi:hypothetical protein
MVASISSSMAVKPRALRWLENAELSLTENPMGQRVVIDLVGNCMVKNLFTFTLGRGIYPVIEEFIDNFAWALVGIGLPTLIIGKGFVGENAPYTKWLKSKHQFTMQKPLTLPFAKLDTEFLKHTTNKVALAKNLGLKNPAQLMPLAQKIRAGKLWIILIDMFGLALFSKYIFTFRNWLTSKLSHKEGYSGEFTYAKDQYVKDKAAQYAKNADWRKLVSNILGFTVNLLVPLASYLT